MDRRRQALLIATAALALFVPGPRAATPQETAARSPRNASYELRAALNPAAHSITGVGRLTWRNISKNPTGELRFHLYWNAWRDASSSWMKEALGQSPELAHRPAEDFGGIDVLRLEVGGQDLAPRATFVAPDDGNRDDRTVMSVPLAAPVAPGQTIQIDLAWSATVPRTFARTGRLGDYYFVAQWFPKMGVLEDTGWNAHQFHAATEFFADFGTYDVSLTVPENWVVGATGKLISKGPADTAKIGTPPGIVHRFVQDDVHDFAWTTSPDFLERTERFEEPGLPPVAMRLLLQPEHADQAGRHFSAARAALKYYGTWFSPYPYEQITIVDPAAIANARAQGEGTRGMEYPTLFTAGTRWMSPGMGSEPEAVTVHEAGHQFWYGVVATNEFEHAWMDEGLNTYSTARVLDEAFPGRFVTVGRYFGGLLAWPFADARWSRAIDGNRLNPYRLAPSANDSSMPTWKQQPGTARLMTYNKAALWLATLERLIGWETMQRALATYYRRAAFRHPQPDELFAAMNEAAGRDLTWFFDAVHRSSATFDYAVDHVSSGRRENGQAHTIVVRRLGEGVFPVTVRVTCEGTVRLLDWDGRDRWKSFEVIDASPVTKVEVDPDRVLLLDVNFTNNSWSATPQGPEAASKWSMRWLTWVQELLLTYAVFA